MTLFVFALFAILLAIQSGIEGLNMVLTSIVTLLSSIFAILFFFARVRRKNRVVNPFLLRSDSYPFPDFIFFRMVLMETYLPILFSPQLFV